MVQRGRGDDGGPNSIGAISFFLTNPHVNDTKNRSNSPPNLIWSPLILDHGFAPAKRRSL
jgi:hypothetical protein